jgi:hypothetical protein
MKQKTPAIAWIYEQQPSWRAILLALALFSVLGPWAYESLHIPSQYACSEPGLRVAEDRCALLLSGISVLPLALGAFVEIGWAILTGMAMLTERGREFLLTGYFALPLLPLISTLLLLVKGGSRRLQAFHVMAWSVALAASLTLLAIGRALPPHKLWGVCLYAGVAACGLVLEIVVSSIILKEYTA